MTVGPVTLRYTEALFELAEERGVLDEVRGDVERISAEVGDPKVESYLLDAGVPHAEKRAKLGELTKGLNPLTAHFVGLVFDKKREAVLIELGAAFRRRFLESRGAVEGLVESARPLETAEISRLADMLGKRLGKEVLLENRIVPDVVGGVRILVDNRLIDNSVRGRLAGLRRRMMSARIASAPSA